MKLWPFTRQEPDDTLREILRLTVLAGRRCAHDLDHAADVMCFKDPEQSDFFRQRARQWKAIFYPAGGPKRYRDDLHIEIDRQSIEIDRLRALCETHGVDWTAGGDIPF